MRKILLPILLIISALSLGGTDRVIDATAVRNGTGYMYIPVTTPVANRACLIDGSQTITSSSVTDTELGFLSGVTSSLQSQINAKASYPSQTGNAGKFLQTDGSSPSWQDVPASGGTVTNVSGTAPISVSNQTTTPVVSIPQATSLVDGFLSAPDWVTFNAKEPPISSGTTLQYWRGDKTFRTLDTLVVPENTNLYYTQGRFDSAFGAKTTTNLTEGSNLYYTQGRFDASFGAKTTTDLTEGSNLYFTTARARGAVSATPPLVDTAGAFSIPQSTTSVDGYLSAIDWTTFNAKEPAIASGTTSQYWRGDKSFRTLDTLAVPENTNLYFTNARAQGAVSATAPLVDTAGVFSIPVATSSVNGYLSSTDWSTFNGKADLASPAFTGIPTAPTASVGTSTTQLATTAFVLSQGFTGATGSMPSASSTTLVTTTSATTSFVTAITASITTTATTTPVLAKCVLDMTSATAASVANMRVTINAVAGGTVSESLTTATTQHLTVANQYLSGSLGPGTYTVNCDFARASGTGTVTVGQGSLTAVALQGASSNGITQLTGLGLSAGPGSGAQSLTGTLSMAGGGSNASLTAANGAIPYSTASALALLAPGTAGQVVRSGGAGAPTWTVETFPASTTINQLLYSSAANVVSGLATANTGALVTSSTGVPSITSGATANRLLRTNGTTVSFAQAALATDVSGTLPVANGGTGLTSVANQRIPFGTGGTALTTDPSFIYDSTNTILSVGGSGTAKINAVNASGSHTALQAYNSSAGNAFQATNVSAYTAALISRQNNATTGASVGFEFGRGTAAAPTGALNGDQIGVLAATPDAASGTAFGYSGAISFVAAEDATTTATGGDIVISTTPVTTLVPVERVRVTNDGLVKSKNGFLNDTSGSQPTCDVSHRGLTWLVQGGAGVADLFQVCMKDAADVYSWVTK